MRLTNRHDSLKAEIMEDKRGRGRIILGVVLIFSIVGLFSYSICVTQSDSQRQTETNAEDPLRSGNDGRPAEVAQATIYGGVPGCVMWTDGATRCWVDQHSTDSGKDYLPQRVPVSQFEMDTRFQEIAIHQRTFCGITLGGALKCGEFRDETPGFITILEVQGPFQKGVATGANVGCANHSFAGVICFPVPTNYDGYQKDNSALLLTPQGREFQGVSIGRSSGCVFGADLTTECWGERSDSEDGETILTPPNRKMVQVVVGARHACGLDGEQNVICWGAGEDASFSRAAQSFGQALPNVESAKVVTAGTFHSCALDMDNQIRCWGLGGTATDQRGAPTIDAQAAKIRESFQTEEFGQSVDIAGEYIDLSSSGHTNCALDISGNVKCWGEREVEFSIMTEDGHK